MAAMLTTGSFPARVPLLWWKFLISQGVPANRLVAAGFGEFQPIAEGDTDQDRATNRRIELKLTER
jgi:chemotaxis protein MotB